MSFLPLLNVQFSPYLSDFSRLHILYHTIVPQQGKGKKRGAAGAAGCVEGLRKRVLKMDRPAAGGFLSLTAFQAEGCGIALSGDEFYNAAFRRSRPQRVS